MYFKGSLRSKCQAVEIPRKGSKISFRNYGKRLPVPFVICTDFQNITKETEKELGEKDKSYAVKSQDHECCGYGVKLVCQYGDELTKPVEVYRGEGAIHKLFTRVFKLSHCWNNMNKNFNKKSKGVVKITNNCVVCGSDSKKNVNKKPVVNRTGSSTI